MRVSLGACWLRIRGPLLGGSLALAAGGLAAGCSGAHEPAEHTERTAGRRPGRPVVNAPAMLGKSIKSLRQRVESDVPLPAAYGGENLFAYLDPTPTDSVVTFRSGHLLLLACYDIHSRRVHDVLLLGRHEDSLMYQAALRPNAPGYLILPVFQASQAGSLLGLRLVDIGTSRN